jgi:hypothetical protein
LYWKTVNSSLHVAADYEGGNSDCPEHVAKGEPTNEPESSASARLAVPKGSPFGAPHAHSSLHVRGCDEPACGRRAWGSAPTAPERCSRRSSPRPRAWLWAALDNASAFGDA